MTEAATLAKNRDCETAAQLVIKRRGLAQRPAEVATYNQTVRVVNYYCGKTLRRAVEARALDVEAVGPASVESRLTKDDIRAGMTVSPRRSSGASRAKRELVAAVRAEGGPRGTLENPRRLPTIPPDLTRYVYVPTPADPELVVPHVPGARAARAENIRWARKIAALATKSRGGRPKGARSSELQPARPPIVLPKGGARPYEVRLVADKSSPTGTRKRKYPVDWTRRK